MKMTLPFGEWQEWVGNLQADKVLTIQLVERDSFDEWMIRIEQRPDHVVFRLAETRIVKAQPLGQEPEDLDIRFGLTGRGQRRTSQLQIIMSVCVVKIGVLEKCRDGQQDVGVVRGVVLKLLEHD